MSRNDWQIEQLGCECVIHRYHVAHLCACGKVLDHSQGTWNAHRDHEMIDFAPEHYRHGDTFDQAFDYLHARGLIDLFADGFRAVYDRAASNEERRLRADRVARLNAMQAGSWGDR